MDYHDFYFWQEKTQFQVHYEQLVELLEFFTNQQWRISNFTIENEEEKKVDPLLRVTIIFIFIVEKI